MSQGAATQTFCAVSPDLEGGAYYSDCALKEPRADAADAKLASALWVASLQIVREQCDVLAQSNPDQQIDLVLEWLILK